MPHLQIPQVTAGLIQCDGRHLPTHSDIRPPAIKPCQPGPCRRCQVTTAWFRAPPTGGAWCGHRERSHPRRETCMSGDGYVTGTWCVTCDRNHCDNIRTNIVVNVRVLVYSPTHSLTSLVVMSLAGVCSYVSFGYFWHYNRNCNFFVLLQRRCSTHGFVTQQYILFGKIKYDISIIYMIIWLPWLRSCKLHIMS